MADSEPAEVRSLENIRLNIAKLEADPKRSAVVDERLVELRRNFRELATGIEEAQDDEMLGHGDWQQELKDLLNPLLNELRRATAQPREIEKLRRGVEDLSSGLVRVRAGLLRLDRLTEEASTPQLRSDLTILKTDLQSQEQSLSTQLEVVNHKLQTKLAGRKPLADTLSDIFQVFFKIRGINLILALCAAVLFWFVARRAQFVSAKFIRRNKESTFVSRIISVIVTIGTGLGAVLVFMLALYFVGDWVLLLITIMLLLGVVWTSKQAVQHLWSHTSLLMNMGSVREGERVMHRGLPWKVANIHFLSKLENPALQGRGLLVPIRDLRELRSREIIPEEPWFPSIVGDWVLWDRTNLAQVVFQGVEYVTLKYLGGEEVLVLATDYYSARVVNLSKGFCHQISIIVNQHDRQDVCTRIMPGLKSAIIAMLNRHDVVAKSVDIEVEGVSDRGISLLVIADFNGQVAAKYDIARRAISAGGFEYFNRCGLTLPEQSIRYANS